MFRMVANEYYRFTTRVGSDVYREFAVQAEDEEHARRVADETVIKSNETIMTVDDVTHHMGEKQKLQDFLNDLNEMFGTERLVVTGGKYVKTIEAE